MKWIETVAWIGVIVFCWVLALANTSTEEGLTEQIRAQQDLYRAQTEFESIQRNFNTAVYNDLRQQGVTNTQVVAAIRELQVVVFPEEFAAAGTTEPEPEPEPETEKE